MVLIFTLRFLIYLDFILVYGVDIRPHFILFFYIAVKYPTTLPSHSIKFKQT